MGGLIYLFGKNILNVSKIRAIKTFSKLLGGLFYLADSNYAFFKDCYLYSTISSLYGGVAFINNTSTLQFEDCIFNETYSRAGGLFFLSDGANLIFFNSKLLNSDLYLNMSEFFKLEGLSPKLEVRNCFITELKDLIINDFSSQGILKFNNTIFHFGKSYSYKALIYLGSSTSEYYFHQNQFFLSNGTKKSFDCFILISGENSMLDLFRNLLNYSVFPIIIRYEKIKSNRLNIRALYLHYHSGSLIASSSFFENTGDNSSSIINIFQSKFILSDSISHFIILSLNVNITINQTQFYLGANHKFSFIYHPANEKNLSSYQYLECLMDTSTFIGYNNQKLENDNPILLKKNYGFFHSECTIINFSLRNSLVNLRKVLLNSLILLEGEANLTINRSVLEGNYLNQTSSHLILLKFTNIPTIHVTLSKITHNRVVLGGVLSLEGHYTGRKEEKELVLNINDSIINNNFAVNKGGLLYSNVSFFQEAVITKFLKPFMKSDNLRNNSIKNNKGTLGKLIFWEGGLVPKRESLIDTCLIRNLLEDPTKYNEISSSVTYLKIVDYNDISLEKGASSFEISKQDRFKIKRKIVKGTVLNNEFYFCFATYDQYNQFVYADSESFYNSSFGNDNLFSSLKFDNDNILINLTFYRGMFCGSKFDFIKNYSELVGRTLEYLFDPFEHSQLFTYLNSSINQKIKITFDIDECKAGEVFDGLNCLPCQRNKYSNERDLVSEDHCIQCTDFNDFYCYGGDLRSPKQNFWRLNNRSESFLKCPNTACVGDTNFWNNYTNKDCFNCYLPLSNKKELIYSFGGEFLAQGYCQHPYKGYLCTECDTGYGSSDSYKCEDCSSKFVYAKELLLLVSKLSLFYFSNWKALRHKMNYHKENIKEVSENYESSSLLKILFLHITILNVLKSLPLNLSGFWEEAFRDIIKVSPNEDFSAFSFQCFLLKVGITLSPVYAKLVINIIFFISSLTLLFGLLYYYEKEAKSKVSAFLKGNLIGLILIFSMDNIVALIGPYIRILFTLNIGDSTINETKLLSDFSLPAWDRAHKLSTLCLSMPCIIGFVFLIPLYILFKILKAKKINFLNTPYFQKNFSYFIYPYRSNALYFEILLIYNKIALVVFKDFVSLFVIANEETFSILIYFFYLISFYILISRKNPYRNEFNKLQKTQNFSLIISVSNTFCALVWSLIQNENDDLTIKLLLAYFSLTNSIFFCFWLQKYFHFLKKILQEVKAKLIKIFKKSNSVQNDSYMQVMTTTEEKNLELLCKELFDKLAKLEEENEKIKIENESLRERLNLYENRSNPEHSFELNERLSSKLIIPNEKKSQSFKHIEIEKTPVRFGKAITHILKKINFKRVLTTLEATCFMDHVLKIRFEIQGHTNVYPIKICELNSLREDWSVDYAEESSKDYFQVFIKKKSFWDKPPLKTRLDLEIKYKQGLDSIEITDVISLLINAEDFLIQERLDWIESKENTYYKVDRILLFEINTPQGELVEMLQRKSFEEIEIKTAKLIINMFIFGKNETELELKLNTRGNLEVYGDVEANLLPCLRDYVKALLI